MKVTFGPWELDPESGILKKYGIALHLREQAIQVLAALVERPGELVTREELRRRLWSDGTFVDFDTGLNTAVSRLREALNDPAGSPRFIETVPRRGYRFIAPVPKQPSLAVMPFVNQSADQEDDYFGDGLTDELIRACWRIDGIRVAGHATVSRFHNQRYDPVRAARELGSIPSSKARFIELPALSELTFISLAARMASNSGRNGLTPVWMMCSRSRTVLRNVSPRSSKRD